MGAKEKLQDEIAEAQRKLNALNRVGEDRFSVGTVVVFSAAGNIRWYYLKVSEEGWYSLGASMIVNVGSGTKTLADWILNALDSDIGYFEVYELKVQQQPFFASA